jgi:hypothetical protein
MGRLKVRPLDGVITWGLAAVFLRLICVFAGMHGDIFYINYFPNKLVSEGVWDIYRYIEHFTSDTLTYYPPLTYFVIGAFQFVFSRVNEGFGSWINEIAEVGLHQWLLFYGNTFMLFKNLLLMKMPYFLFDALMMFSMWKYADDIGQKKQLLRLWSVNPVILYGVYLMGQVDVMPAALAVTAVLCLKKGRNPLGMFFLSLSALLKTYAVFLFLPLFLTLSASNKERIKNLLFFTLPLAIVLGPFFLSSRWLFVSAFFPQIGSVSLDIVGRICFLTQRGVFVLLYVLILKYSLGINRPCVRDTGLKISVAVILALYTLVFVPVHYFLWAIPFLMLCVCLKFIPAWTYWLQIAALFLYALNSPNTTTRLFMPVSPQFFYGLPGLPEMMQALSIRWGYFMLAGQMVFLAICVIMVSDMMGGTSFLKKGD